MNKVRREELGVSYLIAGGAEQIPALKEFLARAGFESAANPDLYIREYPSFKVEHARELRERAQTRAVHGERRIFIIVTPTMTNEAQNALLKTLEEPPADAVFFFVVASPETLLPTVRSRVRTLSLGTVKASEAISTASFLKATPEKRLEMLKPLYDHGDDERDLRGATAFLVALERELAEQPQKAREGLVALYRAREYLFDKGSLLKSLLEQVALLTPRM